MENTENTKDMEQTILGVAEQLFLDKGFARTSTTEIARIAGCNQALVHYYFRTKENLFNRIFEQKTGIVITQLFELSQQNVSFAERIRQIIELHFSILQQNPKLPRMMINEITVGSNRINWLKSVLSDKALPYYAQFEKELQQAIKKGEVRAINAIDLLLDILSMNVFIFIAHPLLCAVTGMSKENFNELTEARKKEAVLLITNGLRP